MLLSEYGSESPGCTLNKKIKSVISLGSEESSDYLETEFTIARNFSRLHGILQLEEERLIRQLREAAEGRKNRLQNLSSQLETQIQNINFLLRECEEIGKGPFVGNMTDLHKRLLEIGNLPCHFISQKDEEKKFKISFNEDLIDVLHSYCTLELPSNDCYELRSSTDLPDGYIIEPLKSESSDSSELEGCETGGVTRSNNSEVVVFNCNSSNCGSEIEEDAKTKKEEGQVPSKTVSFTDRKTYSVRVTYIKTPEEFYVTLNSQWPKQRLIEKKANEIAPYASVPANVSKDEIYLVQYSVDDKFYRGRIVKVLSRNKKGEELVLVHYLDYGNTEEVAKTKLRVIPSEISKEAPLAVKCKLFDCVAKNGKWSRESVEVMIQMIENSTVTMFVMKAHQDCLEVDLSNAHPRNQRSSEIISVRDAILFLEFGTFVRGPENFRNAKSALAYPKQNLPAAGENFRVLVMEIYSPSDFYVQREKPEASFLNKLMDDMQKYYSTNSRKGTIYNPLLGMPCAAIFSKDRKWYRGKIVEILNRKLTVFYVDFGYKEVLPWSSLRKLKECFMKSPPLALHCSLAGIRPKNSESWNFGAVEILKQNFKEKVCSVKVKRSSPEQGTVQVLLYEDSEEKAPSINICLVHLNYATKSNSGSVLKNGFNGGDGKGTLMTAKEEKKEEARSEISDDDDLDLHQKPNFLGHNFKTKVEILSADSPSSIYITFPALRQILESLETELNKFYENSVPLDNPEWTVGSKCVVYSSVKKGWYRATILEILPDEKAKVFLKDIALVSTEPLSSLRVFDESFSKYATCAIECHLSGIQSVGLRWPDITCEFLQNEISTYDDVYITRKGEIKEKSLPIELWAQKIFPGTALEPTVKEWITFNQLLVDQGLAIPNKSKKICSALVPAPQESLESSSVNHKEKSEEPTETCEISEEFFQWLPPIAVHHTDFIGIPTYVDVDSCIYIHSSDQENQLNLIRQSLGEEYGNSKASIDDESWSPGQTCVARYHADGCWYRGSVLKVNEDFTYEVLFVDYGNVETCESIEMRKKVKMTEIPIQTSKYRLSGIVPATDDRKWPLSSIELLHSMIVDKYCRIVVLEKSRDHSEPSSISLKILNSNIDIGKFLVENGLALFEPNSQNNVDVKSLTSSQVKNFTSLIIPKDFLSFSVSVTTIVSVTEFFGKITSDDSLPADVKQVLQEFDNVKQDIETHCSQQPLLNKFEIGQACCCYSENHKWQRAEIEAFRECDKSVCVFYVDQGNKEFVKENLLRECKDEWLCVPKMALKFKLSKVERCPDVPKSAYIIALKNCLENSSLKAEIIKQHEDYFEVKLINKENGSLAYQQMIDDTLMRESAAS